MPADASRFQRISLTMGGGRAVINNEVLGPGMSTPIGAFASDEPDWGAHASGVFLGDSGVLLAEVRRGRARMAAVPELGVVIVGFVLRGEVTVSSDADGQRRVVAGGGFYLGAGTSGTFDWHQHSTVVIVTVPDSVPADLGLRLGAAVGSLNVEMALVRPVASFMESVATLTHDPSALSLYFFEQLVQEQIGALLLSNHAVTQPHPKPNPDLYSRAVELMTARRADPTVKPATIAADLNVSLRQLQRAFTARGRSPARTLRRLRVALAQHLSSNDAYSEMTAAWVAEHSGFSSPQVMRTAIASESTG